MAAKTEADVALEIYESVAKIPDKQKRLRSSTFWRLFDVKKRKGTVVQRISTLLDEQGLRIAVKSGATLGEEDEDDWIMLALKLPIGEVAKEVPKILVKFPPPQWFEVMQTREFESEREVEAYFIAPLLEGLGYNYEDIAMGYPVTMFKGVQKTKTEADFVVFSGATRDKEDALLVIEAKKTIKGISVDDIGQARSYARELMPPCYIVSNSQGIRVFLFNGAMGGVDQAVMQIERSGLRANWEQLYLHVSKEATMKRRKLIQESVGKVKADLGL